MNISITYSFQMKENPQRDKRDLYATENARKTKNVSVYWMT